MLLPKTLLWVVLAAMFGGVLNGCALEEPKAAPFFKHLGSPKRKELPPDHFFSFLNPLHGRQSNLKTVFSRFETLCQMILAQDFPTKVYGKSLWQKNDIFEKRWSIKELYESLPGHPQHPHRLYYSLSAKDGQRYLTWSHAQQFAHEKFAYTVGDIQVTPTTKFEVFDVTSKTRIQFLDVDSSMLQTMLCSFLSYLTNLSQQSSLNPGILGEMRRRFPHLSSSEHLLLARFAGDMPETFNHFIRYFRMHDLLSPQQQQGYTCFRWELQPFVQKIAKDYPDFANSIQRTKDCLNLKLAVLAASNRREIMALHWNYPILLISGALPQGAASLPQGSQAVICRMDLEFSGFGISVDLKGVEIDGRWLTRNNGMHLEFRISRMPEKAELSGFFGTVYDTFTSGSLLWDFFKTLVSRDNGKGSGFSLDFLPEKGKNYFQANFFARLKGNFKRRKNKKGLFRSLLSPGPRRDFATFSRDQRHAFFRDYQAYRNFSVDKTSPR